MPKKSIRKTFKYETLLQALDDFETYSPASIFALAERMGFLISDPTDQIARTLEKRRIINALSCLSLSYHFPRSGDDLVTFGGQGQAASWWGRRWKTLLKAEGVPALGRPMKYGPLLLSLDHESLYTPAKICAFAEQNGLLRSDPNDPPARTLEKRRVRIAMVRLSNNHHFPDEGDGMVLLPGQAPIPGWYGWRWQTTLYQKGREPSRAEAEPAQAEPLNKRHPIMPFDPEEREFIVRWLNTHRRYSAPMIAHLYPGRGADPFPLKIEFLSKLMRPDIFRRLPEPDGQDLHWRTPSPSWYGRQWQQVIHDLEAEEAASLDVSPRTGPLFVDPARKQDLAFSPEEAAYLTSLERHRLYSAALIARRFDGPFLSNPCDHEGNTPAHHRARFLQKLGLHAAKKFPKEDGAVFHENSPEPAWYGHRWVALNEKTDCESV